MRMCLGLCLLTPSRVELRLRLRSTGVEADSGVGDGCPAALRGLVPGLSFQRSGLGLGGLHYLPAAAFPVPVESLQQRGDLRLEQALAVGGSSFAG